MTTPVQHNTASAGAGPRETRDRSRRLTLLCAAWSAGVLTGMCALWTYGAAPGTDAAAQSHWPAQSQIHRDGRPTLVLFAHPLCPCTRASLAELARLCATCGDRVDTHVVLIAPNESDNSRHDAQWQQSAIQTLAADIDGVTLHRDAGRHETRLFGAETSGACLLYAADGRLLFAGGITASRGHEGDNFGRQAIQAWLTRTQPASSTSAVYGCPLFEPRNRSAAASSIASQTSID